MSKDIQKEEAVNTEVATANVEAAKADVAEAVVTAPKGKGKKAEAAEKAEEGTSAPKEKAVKLVKMQRADGKVADVHPDSVSEYAVGGYVTMKG